MLEKISNEHQHQSRPISTVRGCSGELHSTWMQFQIWLILLISSSIHSWIHRRGQTGKCSSEVLFGKLVCIVCSFDVCRDWFATDVSLVPKVLKQTTSMSLESHSLWLCFDDSHFRITSSNTFRKYSVVWDAQAYFHLLMIPSPSKGWWLAVNSCVSLERFAWKANQDSLSHEQCSLTIPVR